MPKFATRLASCVVMASAASFLSLPASADHEKRSTVKVRKVVKVVQAKPKDGDWFTCRSNCGDPLRREGLDWWQSRLENRGGGNNRSKGR